MVFTQQDILNLRASLQDAVVKCSERCLYQAAKWWVIPHDRSSWLNLHYCCKEPNYSHKLLRAAELLDSLPETDEPVHVIGTDRGYMPSILAANPDDAEAELEAVEFNKYLLAKSFFDCREFDRCTAVFLPDALLTSILAPSDEDSTHNAQAKGKGKESFKYTSQSQKAPGVLPELSQKSLFLALYSKMLSGEKRKDEDSESVMGPQDVGSVANKQLPIISRYLKTWFTQRKSSTDDLSYEGSQGWLEYLYGMVLAKEKNTDEAISWFLRSVHLFPMNWGCWLELASATTKVEMVSLDLLAVDFLAVTR